MDEYGGFNRDGGERGGMEPGGILGILFSALETFALVSFVILVLPWWVPVGWFSLLLVSGLFHVWMHYEDNQPPIKREIRRLKAELSRIEFPLQMRGEHRGLARGARGNPLNEHPQIKTLCHQISELEAKLKST